MDLKLDVFIKDKEEKVTFKRDLVKHPYDMRDTISAMKLEQANLALQEKSKNGKVLPKDIESNVRAIAKFASDLFLGQFTTDEAMGIDPADSNKLFSWHSRAMGVDLDDTGDDDGEEPSKK